MTEGEIQQRVLLAVGGRPDARLFRNNVGVGVSGTVLRQDGPDLFLVRGRRIAFGLCPGSADLIGWHSVVVTGDMVGSRIARLLALEIKAPNGRPSGDQRNFIRAVQAAGGIGQVVRSEAEALAALAGGSP